MLILLPPSETKRDGGDGAPLSQSLGNLAFPKLGPIRKKVIAATVALAKNPEESASVLKLSPKQMAEVGRNRVIRSSPTMPAIDRYTGVLYDGLAASTLSDSGREFLAKNVVIQSALLGPVGALDEIPAYRLSFDSKIPGLEAGSLKKAWAAAGSTALQAHSSGQLVLDLRSEGYSALSPVDPEPNVVYLRVVSRGENGQVRALNHFNKKGKGEFVRALALSAGVTSEINSVEDLIAWGKNVGLVLERGVPAQENWPAELNLVVEGQNKIC